MEVAVAVRGTVNLTINGLASRPWLAGGSGIAVTVQRVPDQNPLSAPITVSTQIVAAGTSGVQVPISWQAANGYIPGSAAQLHFTGRQVALHAVRDVDQGEMSLSVDGMNPVTTDDYAPSRNAAGVVWTSPTLASGQHTLTITVQQKDSTSSGNNIAIDRADIS